ncbi:MAG: deoxyribose-phosphate aldolase, partial [Nitriliruptorales bacterium]|nr:deoxyribose-phosphate aldolase [Nitriliruptorales bacterium]
MSSTRPLPSADASSAQLRSFLDALQPLDTGEIRERAGESAAAGVPGSRAEAVYTAIRLTDLTTLEGTDTPERVRDLCAIAVQPDAQDPHCPSVAAACVYSDLAGVAAGALAGSGVQVAAVAASFPSGRAPLAVRVADVEAAVRAGAGEIDLVIDRGAFLDERFSELVAQLRALREAAGRARLKIILETAELGSLTAVRNATWLAMLAGADMVKTSTGKLAGGATLPDVLVLIEAAQAFEEAAGRSIGVKASGGVRTAADALSYLSLVTATAGASWLDP